MIQAPEEEIFYSAEELIQAVNTSLSTCIHIVENEAALQERAGFKFEGSAMRKLIAKFEALKTP